MKKFLFCFMAISFLLSSCSMLSGCGETGYVDNGGNVSESYVAYSDFLYSADKGETYGNGTKEYEVGESVYMKLLTRVISQKEFPETVKMKLTIPNITAIDAKYYDGQAITPVYDPIQNVTVYEFTITAALNPQEWGFVFQFIPNAAAEMNMKLEFDDKIDSSYDKQNMVKFVGDSVVGGYFEEEIKDGYQPGMLRYKIFAGSAYVVWCDPNAVKVKVPEDYFGYPVIGFEPYTFMDCDSLTHVAMPDSILSIECGAFANCDNLEEIILPNTLTDIEYGAFANCVKLEKIHLPSTLVSIEGEAFSKCKALKEIEIPYGVKEIGDKAFGDCYNLKDVYIPQTVFTMGQSVFKGCSNATVYCEADSKPRAWWDDWLGYDGATVIWGAKMPSAVDDGFSTDLIQYEGSSGGFYVKKCNSSAEKVRVLEIYQGEAVGRIFQRAFKDCYNLKEIILPGTLFTIELNAFENCINLQYVDIPNRVNTLESSAFKGCTSLSEVYIPKSVKYMGKNVFEGCNNVIIYCEAESKPKNWSDSWFDGCAGRVVWGSSYPF